MTLAFTAALGTTCPSIPPFCNQSARLGNRHLPERQHLGVRALIVAAEVAVTEVCSQCIAH